MKPAKGFCVRRGANGLAACALCAAAACQTTTTPVNESEWLPKKPAPAAPAQNAPPVSPAPARTSEARPWDNPAPDQGQSVLTPPGDQQMYEYLAGGTWVKIEENGMRRRSLQLNGDGSFVARSDGQNGEKPAFDGLVVQAKGKWSVKGGELRLIPHAGDPVVVQMQWLGDKRLVMLDGDAWTRSQ